MDKYWGRIPFHCPHDGTAIEPFYYMLKGGPQINMEGARCPKCNRRYECHIQNGRFTFEDLDITWPDQILVIGSEDCPRNFGEPSKKHRFEKLIHCFGPAHEDDVWFPSSTCYYCGAQKPQILVA